jgi:hypothetical protein
MKSHVERLMVLRRGVSAAFCSLLFTATLAWADTAGGSTSGGMSPMTLLFLVFLGAIVLLQLVPALVLFSSLIVSIFKRSSRKAETASGEET